VFIMWLMITTCSCRVEGIAFRIPRALEGRYQDRLFFDVFIHLAIVGDVYTGAFHSFVYTLAQVC
jgi:hypothetical protein